MHNFSPTSPVLGDHLQLFPVQPRLRDVWLNVTSPGVFRSPPLSLALRVICQGQSRNVAVWLSQCVAKPSLSSLKNIYLYSNFVCSIPEVRVADFVHPQYSQYFPQHWFTKVWILFSVVLFIRQVSAPYSGNSRIATKTWHLCWTDGFSLLCRLSWTSTHLSKYEMLPLLCWFLSLRQHLFILVCPLYYLYRVYMIPPRYLNDSSSTSPSPSNMIGLSQVVLSLSILVFFLLIFSYKNSSPDSMS